MKNIFKSKEITIVIIAIAIVLIISLCIWLRTHNWLTTTLLPPEGLNDAQWVAYNTAVRDSYDWMFKKIWTVAGLVFGSAYLLLKAIKSN